MKVFLAFIGFIFSITIGFLIWQSVVMNSLRKCRSDIFGCAELIEMSLSRLDKLNLELRVSAVDTNRVVAIRGEKKDEYALQSNLIIELNKYLDKYRQLEKNYFVPVELRYKFQVYKEEDFFNDSIFASEHDPFFKAWHAITGASKA